MLIPCVGHINRLFSSPPWMVIKGCRVVKDKCKLVVTIWLWVCLDRTYFAETENWKHFVETENWKHYSKIIFKCVNSAVGSIFNEKVTEKCNLWVHKQYTNALFTDKKSTNAAKKKEELKRMESKTWTPEAKSKQSLWFFFLLFKGDPGNARMTQPFYKITNNWKKIYEIYCIIGLVVILILLTWLTIIMMVLPSSSLAVEAMNHFQS